MGIFKLVAPYSASGDQPTAIDAVCRALKEGKRFVTLLGVTGSGKTFTMANIIAHLERPALVISHNKTLAAQLYLEFKEFFPDNAVCYFVSYYDYYQPEAYVVERDLYIEKDASLNEKIDQLRHEAVSALVSRRDVIVVATVSCLYGLGSPDVYEKKILRLKVGDELSPLKLVEKLLEMGYKRNDLAPEPASFRLSGDVVTIFLPNAEDMAYRVEFWGDEIERIVYYNVVSQDAAEAEAAVIFPATFYLLDEDAKERAIESIEKELAERVEWFKKRGKLLEAERLLQRTRYDLAMLKETGYCKGIENYSRHIDGRKPGQPPATLISFFPRDFITFIDESHITIPQLRAMREGDRSRKKSLIEYGFRLPSAYDNRPLTFEEFLERTSQIVFVSATPGDWELSVSEEVAELVVRPTGLLEPLVEVRDWRIQTEDVIMEMKKLKARGERAIVAVLTKKMAEKLAAHLRDLGIKAAWLHSELGTLERQKILADLRRGIYDCVVGINLLREGIDLPEVSTVFILDADKEGFLRSKTSLIQLAGRAARHVNGRCILYAERMSRAMKEMIEEVKRRRRKQEKYNKEHGITPSPVIKPIIQELIEEQEKELDKRELLEKAKEIYTSMIEAAENLEFEKAQELKEKLQSLLQTLRMSIQDLAEVL